MFFFFCSCSQVSEEYCCHRKILSYIELYTVWKTRTYTIWMHTVRSQSGGADAASPQVWKWKESINGRMTQCCSSGNAAFHRISPNMRLFIWSAAFLRATIFKSTRSSGARARSPAADDVTNHLLHHHNETSCYVRAISNFICRMVCCFSPGLCSNGLFFVFIPGQSFPLGSEPTVHHLSPGVL